MKFTSGKGLFCLFVLSISVLSLAKVDAEGNNSLMRAARQGSALEVSNLLLMEYSGSNINNQNNNGNTALMLAVMSRDVPTIQSLLQYNAIDLGIKNKAGKTALDFALELAVDNEGDEIVQLIRKYRRRFLRSRGGKERRESSPRGAFNYTWSSDSMPSR